MEHPAARLAQRPELDDVLDPVLPRVERGEARDVPDRVLLQPVEHHAQDLAQRALAPALPLRAPRAHALCAGDGLADRARPARARAHELGAPAQDELEVARLEALDAAVRALDPEVELLVQLAAEVERGGEDGIGVRKAREVDGCDRVGRRDVQRDAAVGAGDVPHGEVVGEVGLEVVHGARVEVFDMVFVRHPDERGELCELYALPGDDGESNMAHVRFSS